MTPGYKDQFILTLQRTQTQKSYSRLKCWFSTAGMFSLQLRHRMTKKSHHFSRQQPERKSRLHRSSITGVGGGRALLKAIKKNKTKEPRRNFKKCMSVWGVIAITYTSVCIEFKRTQCWDIYTPVIKSVTGRVNHTLILHKAQNGHGPPALIDY